MPGGTDAAPCQMKPSTFWPKPTPISDRCYADLLARFAQAVRFRDKISAIFQAPTLDHSGFSLIGRRIRHQTSSRERLAASLSEGARQNQRTRPVIASDSAQHVHKAVVKSLRIFEGSDWLHERWEFERWSCRGKLPGALILSRTGDSGSLTTLILSRERGKPR